jgi:transcriptional regulator with XRE-family HTH domain
MRPSRRPGARRLGKSIFTEEYDAFRELLRSLRQEAGLSQDELAERIGTFQAFVSQSERGQRRVDIIEARAFCTALGVDFADFVQRLERILAELPDAKAHPTHQAKQDTGDEEAV